ncbi:hypothetical protein X997_4082 [Burkholderia pseudomallei A79C]|nr:hypothetical protein X997_4082 [Burkholderia pseudomallei A79C]
MRRNGWYVSEPDHAESTFPTAVVDARLIRIVLA